MNSNNQVCKSSSKYDGENQTFCFYGLVYNLLKRFYFQKDIVNSYICN